MRRVINWHTGVTVAPPPPPGPPPPPPISTDFFRKEYVLATIDDESCAPSVVVQTTHAGTGGTFGAGYWEIDQDGDIGLGTTQGAYYGWGGLLTDESFTKVVFDVVVSAIWTNSAGFAISAPGVVTVFSLRLSSGIGSDYAFDVWLEYPAGSVANGASVLPTAVYVTQSTAGGVSTPVAGAGPHRITIVLNKSTWQWKFYVNGGLVRTTIINNATLTPWMLIGGAQSNNSPFSGPSKVRYTNVRVLLDPGAADIYDLDPIYCGP